jgi:DNA mismatch endonuclease (patch repair protein)
MADTFTRQLRSEVMSRIRSSGNSTTEMRLIAIMRRHAITGWRRNSRLPGRPDFVFRKDRVAVFVDGDFWHGNPKRFRLPKSNVDYWATKIDRNRARDREINRTLRKRGWTVLRIWESSLSNEPAIAARLTRMLAISTLSR